MKNMKEDRQETTQQTKSQCHREREEEPVTIQHQLFLTYLLYHVILLMDSPFIFSLSSEIQIQQNLNFVIILNCISGI
jgi:hypothetical protein